MQKHRVLVFVIAYQAESTLLRTLERIPPEIFETYDCEVLVVDDASDDRTFLIGRAYKRAHADIPITVLRNQYNRGYGGNQKVGYAYAIAEGFDFVVMVHGDGQYAPEELPRMLRPLAEGAADAVFGSRMSPPRAALKGGMPLYKFVGNRILTAFQNAVLRAHLSEFHSGYRAYAIATLRRLPFRLNTDDFHFDTEIIIQLLHAGARIAETPIPTYYGDEISRVNGMRYAKDVTLATLKSAAHRMGVLYQRRFDCGLEEGAERYQLKLGYDSSHQWALDRVPDGASVIDLGGGTGAFARELGKKGCAVTIVDAEATPDPRLGIAAVRQDLDDPPQFDVRAHDYLVLLDVIEHLADPERFIERLRKEFDDHSRTVVLTTPNVAFIAQRVMLLFGQFNYGKLGILDRTHKRLFTFRSIRQLLDDAGFRIRIVRGIPAPFPKVLGNGPLGRTALAINRALIALSPTLFAYQVYLEAETTPDVDYILADTRARSHAFTTIPPRASN